MVTVIETVMKSPSPGHKAISSLSSVEIHCHTENRREKQAHSAHGKEFSALHSVIKAQAEC